MAVGGVGGAGGDDCLVSATILTRGSVLVVADRGYQAAVDAVLDLCRATAVLGNKQAGKSASSVTATERATSGLGADAVATAATLSARLGRRSVYARHNVLESLGHHFVAGVASLAWFAAVAWQSLRLLRQRLRLACLLRQSTPADKHITGTVVELAGQLGLRHVPTAVSVANDCPVFVCGIWRSWLVLPLGLMARLDECRRRQVILHELAHIKRHDLAWAWPAEIAKIIYFFNPLAYWVAYQLGLERELACDQLAMARSGHPPADYAQTLVQVISHTSESAAIQAAIAAGLTGSQPPSKQQ